MSVIDPKQELIQLLEEKKRRAKLAINNYKPSNLVDHNQLSFHTSKARFRLLTGGNQSGKSLANAAEIAFWVLGKHPYRDIPNKPKKILCVGPEYRLLYEGLYRHLRPDGPTVNGAGFIPPERLKRYGSKVPGHEIPSFIEVWWDKEKTQFSTINFISVRGDEEGRTKVQSAAADLVSIDEEIAETIFKELLMRLLATNGECIVSATLIKSEPWVLDLESRAESGDASVHLTRLNLESNIYVDENARRELTANFSDEEKAVRVKGFSKRRYGLVYNEVGTDHYVEPFEIPKTWPRYVALDPGFRRFAGLWIAHDIDNDLLYAYREMYIGNASLIEVADFIYETENWKQYDNKNYKQTPESEYIKYRLIDPAAARNLETGELGVLAQMAGTYNIYCTPADNSLQAGITSVHLFLARSKVGDITVPRLRFFKGLKYLHREIRDYKLNPESARSNSSRDEPIRRNNHLMDCLRYICQHMIKIVNPEILKYHQGKAVKLVDQYNPDLIQSVRKDKKPCHPFLGSEW